MNGSVGYIYQRLSLKICFHEIDGSGGQIRSNYVVVNILFFFRKYTSWIQTYTAKNRSQIKQCPHLTSNTSLRNYFAQMEESSYVRSHEQVAPPGVAWMFTSQTDGLCS